MSSSAAPLSAGDVVPLSDRLRYMFGFRLLVAFVTGGLAALGAENLRVDALQVPLVIGAYLLVALGGRTTWGLSRQAGLRIFGFTLLVDGAFLAWGSYATGGFASPVRYLIILHIIAVALLASYRSGMKLALWHSLLLLVVHYAEDGGLLRPATHADSLPGSALQQLVGFCAVFWFVAVATASFSAVNERELRRRRFDMEALATMGARLEEAPDPGAVGAVVADSVIDTFTAERVLVVAAPTGRGLTVLAARGTEVRSGDLERGPGSVLEAAMRERRTQLASHLEPAADPNLAAMLPGARDVVVVPLSCEGSAIGALVVERAGRMTARVERRIVSMLERFAGHAALALRNAWLLDEVSRLAATDALTGLPNRATWQEALGRELGRARREGRPLSVIMADIDYFKLINDTHGHQVGDEVLQRIAAVFDDGSRSFDLPARYGGEEFGIVLPETDVEEALAVAERLRATIADDLTEPRVTASLGVASYPLHAAEAEALVRAADEALYASKRVGRDRVTAATPARDLAA